MVCVGHEDLIEAHTHVAMDADPSQIRASEKLKDPDAIRLVNYLNSNDLRFLKEKITTTDRVLVAASDPTSWPFIFKGARTILTGVGGKEQLIAAGISGTAVTAIQYGTTGEVKLSDVIGAGVVGLITAGKGYNPTVTWNAVGGYYSAEIKGDAPLLGTLLSKTGASMGYAGGNLIKVPMDKVLNPISKQYEWASIGIWTITKPLPMHPLPSISGNIGGSAVSEAAQDKLQKIGKAHNDK
jgi:filamentous hemagglutinin